MYESREEHLEKEVELESILKEWESFPQAKKMRCCFYIHLIWKMKNRNKGIEGRESGFGLTTTHCYLTTHNGVCSVLNSKGAT